MRNGEWSKVVSVTGRTLLAFLFVFSQSVWAAGQEQKAQDNPKPAQKAATQSAGEKPSSAAVAPDPQTPNVEGEESERAGTQEKPSGDGKHEGIKVHGHWTIEVHNGDGSLVTHREFENSLVKSTSVANGGGDYFLVGLLGRTLTLTFPGRPSFWEVTLSGGTSGLCATTTSFRFGGSQNPTGTCVIGESPDTTADSNNLTLTPSGFGQPTQSLTLNGFVSNVASPGTVAVVGTDLSNCTTVPPPGFPSNCGLLPFTSAPVSPAVPVAAGQTISVTVVISFS